MEVEAEILHGGIAHLWTDIVKVEWVFSEEVHSDSFSQDTRDSFQPAVTS